MADTPNEDLKNGFVKPSGLGDVSTPVSVTDSSMHIISLSTGKQADNPLSPDKQKSKHTDTKQRINVSPDGRYLVDRDTNAVAENPLDIRDPVKADNVAVLIRTGMFWTATLMVMWMALSSSYAQLVCTPPRAFAPPIELVGIILGLYGGSNSFVARKLLSVVERFKK